MEIPLDEQCQYHSEYKGYLHSTFIQKCSFRAVAVAKDGLLMCKRHRNNYDKRALKLGLPLSVDLVKDTTK